MKSIILALALLSPSAFAYYSTWDTGDVLKAGHYESSLEAQFVTTDGSGANLVGRFDMPVQDDSSARVMLGAGTVDFHMGGFYKYVPYPDTDKQPAIGLIGGVLYARNEGNNYMTVRIAPIVSKAFHVDFGTLTPYASLPIGLCSRRGGTDVPAILALGSDLQTSHFKHMRWRAELGFNLNDAYSYVSLGAILNFDEENGISFE